MKRIVPILLLLFAGLAAPAAQAQDNLDPAEVRDRVARELARTTELLERVVPRVQESDNPRARDFAERAVALQQKAVQAFQAGAEADNPTVVRSVAQAVLGLTLRARDFAQRAAKIVQEDVSLQERARRLIEQADTQWERLRDIAADGQHDRARAILAEARKQIEASRRHFDDHQFEIAMRLAESALRLMDPLRDAASGDMRLDRLEGQLERMRAWIERAQTQRDQLDEPQQRRLDQAITLLNRASEAYAEGNAPLTHRLVQQLRTLLRDIRPDANPTVDEDDVDRALSRFDAEHERLREMLESSSGQPEEAARLLERALDERQTAVESSSNGQFEEALRRLRAALDMLSRARRLLGAR